MVETRFKLEEEHKTSNFNGVVLVLNGVKSKPFGEYTPSAYIKMTIANPEIEKYFKLGATYRVLFEEIEE